MLCIFNGCSFKTAKIPTQKQLRRPHITENYVHFVLKTDAKMACNDQRRFNTDVSIYLETELNSCSENLDHENFETLQKVEFQFCGINY